MGLEKHRVQWSQQPFKGRSQAMQRTRGWVNSQGRLGSPSAPRTKPPLCPERKPIEGSHGCSSMGSDTDRLCCQAKTFPQQRKKKKLIRGWVGAAETGKHKNKERRGRLSTSCEVGAVETIPGMTALNPKSAGQRLNYRSFAGERMEMEVA